MTKEEKKAIHMLQSYAGMTHKLTDNQGRPKLDQAIDVFLNLIQKQQVEIEKLNKQAQEYFETIMFKDMVIDEMAGEIIRILYYCDGKVGNYKTPYVEESISKTLDNIKQYFEKKAREECWVKLKNIK